MAIMALKIGAPTDYMQQLEEHANIVNLPRVGVDENVAFPAVQVNIAPAVALDDALGILNYNPDISHHLLTPSFREGS
jgi:hypothetical protein